MAEAALAGVEGASVVLAEVLLPDVLRVDSEAVLAGPASKRRRHLLSSNWAVPVRWFVLFADTEREFAAGASGVTLRYRTEMARARQRAARAVDVLLRRLGPEAEVIAAVESMARWLERFHPRAMVELDYGGIAQLFEIDDLQADHSAGDVAAVLGALSRGDGPMASQLYEGVLERWRQIQAGERAN
jgi:hypothetical protein